MTWALAFKAIKNVLLLKLTFQNLGKNFKHMKYSGRRIIKTGFSETRRWLQMGSKTLTKDLLSKNECFISVERSGMGFKLKILSA